MCCIYATQRMPRGSGGVESGTPTENQSLKKLRTVFFRCVDPFWLHNITMKKIIETSAITTLFVTLAVTLFNFGWDFTHWMLNWTVAWPVAALTAWIIVPLVVTRKNSVPHDRELLDELSMAHEYKDPAKREYIVSKYKERFSPRRTPFTNPELFDPLNPPEGYAYDPYYECWVNVGVMR